jgi:hypothetical protein
MGGGEDVVGNGPSPRLCGESELSAAFCCRFLRKIHQAKAPIRAAPTIEPMTGPAIQAWLEGLGGAVVVEEGLLVVEVDSELVVVLVSCVILGGLR